MEVHIPNSLSSITSLPPAPLPFESAVLRWLAAFPQSTVTVQSLMLDPVTLYKIFRIILNAEDWIGRNDNDELFSVSYKIESTSNDWIVPRQLILQIQCLEGLLDTHLANSEVMGMHLMEKSPINWLKLVLCCNEVEIEAICHLLVKIATYTSNLVNFGLTSLVLIDKNDRELIDVALHRFERQRNELARSPNFKAKKFNLAKSHDIDDDYIDALLWENSILENALYKSVTSK